MRLELSNFRCHGHFITELPDNGLILLSGGSGNGKSTVLKGILYALYGAKSTKKPCSFNTTSCAVKLDIQDLKITRTNKPTRLIVIKDGETYEDIVAQEMINAKLGCYEEFLCSSYIPQKNNMSILSQPPLEQIKLVKSLAFDNEKTEGYRDKLKTMISEAKENLSKTNNELEFAQNQVDEFDAKNIPTFPLENLENKSQEEIIEEFKITVSETSDHLEELNNEKMLLNEIQLQRTELSNLLVQKQEWSEKQEKLQEKCSSSNANIEQHLKKYKQRLVELQLFQETNLLENQIAQLLVQTEQSKKEEYDEISTIFECTTEILSIDYIKERIEKETHALVQLNNDYSPWIEYKNALDKVKELGGRGTPQMYLKELLLEQEEMLKTKPFYKCPKCEQALYLHENKLYEKDMNSICNSTENFDQEKLDKITEKIAIVKNISYPKITDKNLYTNMKKEIDSLTLQIDKFKEYQNQYKQLNCQDSSITRLKKTLEGKQEKVSKYVKPTNLEKELEQCRNQILELEQQVEKMNNNQHKLAKITAQLNALIQKIDLLTKKITNKQQQLVFNIDNVDSVNDEIVKTKKVKEQQETLLKKVILYEEHLYKTREYKKWVSKINALKEQLQEASKVYRTRLQLKEKLNEAEILALDSTINSLNEHTRYYLDTFFPDNPMSAKLSCDLSETKLQTLKITTQIQYKGNYYDNINQLSGGEFDRCTLASICGVNSMLQSNLLLLDESLSSLDADTNTEILNFLKELSSDKLVLVCSHEAVKGIFDEIIDI